MSDHSKYTSSQKRPNKTEWSASIKADEGYTPGRLNKENGILESDTSIYASESIDNTLYILVDQYDHQHRCPELSLLPRFRYGKLHAYRAVQFPR